MDFFALKRSRMGIIQGSESIHQIEHVHAAGAKMVVSGILVAGTVVTTDTSAAPVRVGIGSILRIKVSADTYVAFDDEALLGVVSVTTTPALLLPAGFHLVVATGYFMRTSAVLDRLEITESV